MTLYTINLSRARTVGRNKRAKKASSILREELERHEGEEISISNEVNQKIWSRGASKPPRKVDIEVVEAEDGLWAVLSDKAQDSSGTSEDESEEVSEDTEEGEYTESDYEEALDGTVSEAQEAIEDFEDPDYDKLIQLEEEGKDRKTLLDFLESQQ